MKKNNKYIRDKRTCGRILKKEWDERGFVCKKCGTIEFYENLNDLSRTCKKCHYINSLTNGTIFHDVRFGLLKAFRMMLKCHYNNYSCTSIELSNEFGVSRQYCSKFQKKISERKDEVIKLVNRFEALGNVKEKGSRRKINKKTKDYGGTPEMLKMLKRIQDDHERLKIDQDAEKRDHERDY